MNTIVTALTALVICGVVTLLLLRRYMKGTTKCPSNNRMDGKTVVITGGETGIGKETARELSRRGARIVIGSWDFNTGMKTASDIRVETGGDVVVHRLDLSSLSSVRSFANKVLSEEPHIHVLINNSGIMACPYTRSEDGFEMQFAVNYLGHFLLTILLLERLKESGSARIINVSSCMHIVGRIQLEDIHFSKKYSRVMAYSQSKLAMLMFTRSLAKRLNGTGASAYAVHPGITTSQLGRYLDKVFFPKFSWTYQTLGPLVFKTPLEGAQTAVYCAVDSNAGRESGMYYRDCRVTDPAPHAKDDDVASKLWDLSVRLVGLKPHW